MNDDDNGRIPDYTYSHEGAKCPYCGYLTEACESDGQLYDESTCDWRCANCDGPFDVSLYREFSWTCKPLPHVVEDVMDRVEMLNKKIPYEEANFDAQVFERFLKVVDTTIPQNTTI